MSTAARQTPDQAAPEGTAGSAEDARLQLLEELAVFDTDPEEPFDTLTDLAADICGAPISLISLVGADRQFFKSRYGTELTGTPRSASFCAHAIEQPGDLPVFEVPDTHADDRFRSNPLVVNEPFIRRYAGVPLRPTGGPTVGTLCVIGPEAGRLRDEQREALVRLGTLVEHLLRLRLIAKTEAEAHERADRSQRYYRYLADNTADVVFIHDAGLVTRYMSPNAPEFLGYSKDEVVAFGSGHPVFADGEAERLTTAFNSLSAENPTTSLRVKAINKDGSIRPVAVHTKAIFGDGAIEEFHSTARDISDIVASEQVLEETNLQLRTMVDQRSKLVRGIAHDLAAPVAALRITVESLQARTTEPLMLEQVDRLQEFAKSVEAFLTDLRTVTEPEYAGYALEPQATNLKAVVERAMAQVPHIPGRQLTVDLEDADAHVDPHALSRIVTNLLNNAHQHTPSGTPITVSLRPGSARGAEPMMATLTVRDLGPGIAAEDRSRSFEPYVTSSAEGSGLGLAITKALVEGLGGTISLSGNSPSGTVVTVRLPVSSPSGAERDTRPAAPG